jgi:hypothetical protein
MAAKKKIAPPKPLPNRPWSQLTKAEQNAEYVHALHAYGQGSGPNPASRSSYAKGRATAEAAG